MPLIMKVESTKARIMWKIHVKTVCMCFYFWTQFRLSHVHKGEPRGIAAARFYRPSCSRTNVIRALKDRLHLSLKIILNWEVLM